MNTQLDFEKIKEGYKKYYNEALKTEAEILPLYEIQLWDKVLNPIEIRMFEDIRMLGLQLYPIFPVAENSYLHFANPFKRIGIEIIYKATPANLITRKLTLLKPQGWKIYTILSQNTYHTIDEFFRIKRKNKSLEFVDISSEMQLNFVEKFHQENAACLLNYIRHAHF